MSYELSPFPPALFEARKIYRKADKPQVAYVISEHARDGVLDSVPETETCPRWKFVTSSDTVKKGETYGAI